MAQTNIAGFGGSVTSASAIISVAACFEWSGTITANEIILPPAFGAVWTSTVLGAFRMTGSLTCKGLKGAALNEGFPKINDDTSDPQDDWSDTELKLLADTGVTWAMPAVLTGVDMTRTHDGGFNVNANFANTGPVTQAWAVA